jgi:hypothetical protein
MTFGRLCLEQIAATFSHRNAFYFFFSLLNSGDPIITAIEGSSAATFIVAVVWTK